MEGPAPLAIDLVTGPALSTMLPFGGGGGGADTPRRRLASSLLFSFLFSFFRRLRASNAPFFFGGGAFLGAGRGAAVRLPLLRRGGGSFSLPRISGSLFDGSLRRSPPPGMELDWGRQISPSRPNLVCVVSFFFLGFFFDLSMFLSSNLRFEERLFVSRRDR